MNHSEQIPNLALPIATAIRNEVRDLTSEQKVIVFEGLTEDEFIGHRVDIYLRELEIAMQNGYDELGAKEIALKECLAGIIEDYG